MSERRMLMFMFLRSFFLSFVHSFIPFFSLSIWMDAFLYWYVFLCTCVFLSLYVCVSSCPCTSACLLVLVRLRVFLSLYVCVSSYPCTSACLLVLIRPRVFLSLYVCVRVRKKRWLMDDYRGLWLRYCCFNIDSPLHGQPHSCLTLFSFFRLSFPSIHLFEAAFRTCVWFRGLVLCLLPVVFFLSFALPGIEPSTFGLTILEFRRTWTTWLWTCRFVNRIRFIQ